MEHMRINFCFEGADGGSIPDVLGGKDAIHESGYRGFLGRRGGRDWKSIHPGGLNFVYPFCFSTNTFWRKRKKRGSSAGRAHMTHLYG